MVERPREKSVMPWAGAHGTDAAFCAASPIFRNGTVTTRRTFDGRVAAGYRIECDIFSWLWSGSYVSSC